MPNSEGQVALASDEARVTPEAIEDANLSERIFEGFLALTFLGITGFWGIFVIWALFQIFS